MTWGRKRARRRHAAQEAAIRRAIAAYIAYTAEVDGLPDDEVTPRAILGPRGGTFVRVDHPDGLPAGPLHVLRFRHRVYVQRPEARGVAC